MKHIFDGKNIKDIFNVSMTSGGSDISKEL